METMPISEFKAHALEAINRVAKRKEPIVITKRGKPVAEVIPYAETKPQEGRLAEALVYEKDIISPLGEETWHACR